MPAVVAGALVSAIGLTGVVATVATAAIGTVASFAVQSLTARSSRSSRNLVVSGTSTGRRLDLVRSATEPRRVVYGKMRVSGPLAFAYTTNAPTGQKNYVLSLVVPLAAHEVEEIGALYVNDVRVEGVPGAEFWTLPPAGSVYNANTSFNGVNGVHHIQWRAHTGHPDQTADYFLTATVPVWSVQHRLRGVAYVAARLNWDSGVWADGLPNLSWEVTGRKVYDPRTGLTEWSDNPALCIRDYLLSPFGLSCAPDEVDEASFIAAATLCEERVPDGVGGDQPRYTCNGVFALDEKPIDVMEKLLSACAGTLVYSQGCYRLYPAAYRFPLLDLDSTLLRGPVIVRPQTTLRQKANTVRGTFLNPARGWIETDFPPVSADLALDQGQVLMQDLDLPFTTNAVEAQRLARLHLQRCRHPLTVEMPCTLAALGVAVMEPIRLTLPELGWTQKIMTPVSWTLTPDGGVDLVLEEDDPSFYAWTGGAAPDTPPPDVVLPGLYPDPPLVTVTEALNADGLCLSVALGAADNAFTARTEVEFRPGAGGEGGTNPIPWQAAGSGASVTLPGVSMGATYEIRARTINVAGLTSAWTLVRHTVTGTTAPPSDVPALTATVVDSTLYLDWTRPSGTAVDHYRLRWSPLLSGATWAGAMDVSASLTNTRTTLPARPGTYLLKAVDGFGRESAAPAMVLNTAPDPRNVMSVASQTESPSFPGVRSNCTLTASNQLVLGTLGAFDAQTGLFDAVSGVFDLAGGGAIAEGTYTFAAPVDLGAVYTVRVSADVRVSVLDLVTDVDGAPGLFDEREGVFDGDSPSAVDVRLDVATTPDSTAGAPVWSAWTPLSLGDYKARGLKFRAVLSSRNPMATPAVDALTVSVDMQERVDSGAAVLSSATGTTVTFANAFKTTPAIGVTGANLQTGDYVTLTGQSRTGFTAQFRTSAGVGVARSFDWVARGYGKSL